MFWAFKLMWVVCVCWIFHLSNMISFHIWLEYNNEKLTCFFENLLQMQPVKMYIVIYNLRISIVFERATIFALGLCWMSMDFCFSIKRRKIRWCINHLLKSFVKLRLKILELGYQLTTWWTKIATKCSCMEYMSWMYSELTQ